MRALIIVMVAALAPATAVADAGKLQRRQQTVIVKHQTIGDTPIIGRRFAPVTVDFFLSLSDPYYAKRILAKLRLLAARHPTRMRIVFRPTERSSYSYWYFAEAALEAYAQGKFFEFTDEMHKHSRRPDRKQVSEVARAVGMDVERLEKALTSRRHKATMEANFNYYMQRMEMSHPQEPLLFNGKKPTRAGNYYRSRYSSYWASRYMNLSDFENTYDEAYKRGKLLLERGVALPKLYRAIIDDLDAHKPPKAIQKGYLDNQPADWHRNKTALRPLTGKVDLSGPHVRGPKNAPVTLAIFCSFNGNYCRSLKTSVVDYLVKTYPNKVRIVFKHLFDDEYRGTSSYYKKRWSSPRKLHEASLCADDQGAFWRFFDLAYVHSYRYRYRAPTMLELQNHAKQLQLDVKLFSSCMTDHRHAKRLQAMVVEARKANVIHTPSIIIGGRLYEGSKNQHEVMSLIQQELAPGWLRRRWPDEDNSAAKR